MSPPRVYIIQTGVANIASMMAAFHRLHWEPVRTDNPNDIRRASHVVLPGVGTFGQGMATLNQLDMIDSIRARVASNQPILAVCLGLQLLCQSSEESPGVKGLGVIPADITRFPADFNGRPLRVPQFGWNQVQASADCALLSPGFAYFANSYRLKPKTAQSLEHEGWHMAWTEHGPPFISALERGRTLACQFHPEISGPWGLQLLDRWLKC